MLTGFPLYLYFKNGNPFSGCHSGMRYVLKQETRETESGKTTVLSATVWPGPWSIEHTDPEKFQTAAFEANQSGLDAASEWLAERYNADKKKYDTIPSILDCEPDR